jgi:hypothetical protein
MSAKIVRPPRHGWIIGATLFCTAVMSILGPAHLQPRPAADSPWIERETHVGFGLLVGSVVGLLSGVLIALKNRLKYWPEERWRFRISRITMLELIASLCIVLGSGVVFAILERDAKARYERRFQQRMDRYRQQLDEAEARVKAAAAPVKKPSD